MPKYKSGDKVYHMRWKGFGALWPAMVIQVVPKKWWQIQRQYLIDDSPDANLLIVEEKDLIPREDKKD
jgi:hypothetical protein